MGAWVWPAGWVIVRYFSIEGNRAQPLNRETAAEIWGVDKNYAGVALHELRGALLIDRPRRGEYLPVSPERWVGVHSFLARKPEVGAELMELLRDSMNQVESLALYGSRVWGEADELSDWDFLLVLRSREARDLADSKLQQIQRRNPKFDAEVLSLQDFEHFLLKDPIFLKLVARDSEPILDWGLIGIAGAAEITQKHIAVELLAARHAILRGIALTERRLKARACYWLARGVRRTLAAKLAMQGRLSGKILEEEFMKIFPEHERLRAIVRKVRAKRGARATKKMLKRLMEIAILEWERTSKRLRKYGKKRKIKKPTALLAQLKAHERYVEEFAKSVSDEVIKHWKREAKRLEREVKALTEGLSRSYLEGIRQVSDKEAEKLIRKKRRKL